MLNRRIVECPRLARIPAPTPAKALLRPEVAVSVQQSCVLLPILGARNPEAALLIGHSIINYMPPTDDDGGHAQLGSPAADALGSSVITYTPRRQAARHRLRRMREAADLRKRHIGDELRRNTQRDIAEIQRDPHHDLMALLRNMAGPVSSAA